MSWVYRVMSVGGFSSLLGVVEIAIGVLIALRPVWPMGSAVGSGLAAGVFLTTLSFLVTTPGLGVRLERGPVAGVAPGDRPTGDRAAGRGPEGRGPGPC